MKIIRLLMELQNVINAMWIKILVKYFIKIN